MIKRKVKTNSIMQKQIPTIVGLLLLVGALVLGLVFFGNGTGVFAPRATAQTTPKNIRVTNVSHDSFTVSFFTDEATPGFVKYGVETGKLNSQVRDDRDQLSGSIDDFQLHHVTIRGLEPNTEYYYVLGTGSNAEFDQEGQPFTITTTAVPTSSLPESITIFGSVALASGAPAQGSIIYVTAPGMQDMSSLVKGSGSWAIPLSQALNSAGTEFASLTATDQITILAQGLTAEERLQLQLTVSEAQPIELVFGQDITDKQTAMTDAENSTDEQTAASDSAETATDSASIATDSASIATDSASIATNSASTATQSTISGHLKELLDEAEPLASNSSASSELLLGDLSEETSEMVYTNSTPVIKGKVAPNVEVKLEIHSTTQYEETVTTDSNGEFSLDTATLNAELEPGEHTVTYTYIDPDTGLEVVKTEFFWVEDSNQTIAMADNDIVSAAQTSSTTPNGTGDPYSMPTTTPTVNPTTRATNITPVPTATTKPSSTTATSSTSSTREYVGTDSSTLKAGSVGVTALMILSGFFFILVGSWSWWLAGELE